MSSDPGDRQPTYDGGIEAVLTQMEGRRDPLSFAQGEALPSPDTDMRALRDTIVCDPDSDPAEAPPFRSGHHRKRHELRKAFTGQSELVCLHGLVIAHLRKRAWPAEAPVLFQRLWREESCVLLDRLDPRWLVSAATTFGDHGVTDVQRGLGLGLSTLFGTMKLYESERLFSGHAPDQIFDGTRARAPLPLEMDAYALNAGGLDINMLGRLWREAEKDTVIQPLAHHLLDLLLHDARTVFRRLAMMRVARQPAALRAEPATAKPVENAVPVPPSERDPDHLRWGLVTTTDAAAHAITRWAAHHLALGAKALHIYLEDDREDLPDAVWQDARVSITRCTPTYWQAVGKPRPARRAQRHTVNATRALRATAPTLHWLGHLDIDEFLLPVAPVATALAAGDGAAAVLRMEPVEALATADGTPPGAFKRAPAALGLDPAVLQDLYPTFGLHLASGFLGPSASKVFARTGLPDTRLARHALRKRGQDVGNASPLPAVYVAHVLPPNWDNTRAAAKAKRRDAPPGTLSLPELLDYLQRSEGEPGLWAFFSEVCADTPDLRARLAARDLLVDATLDLDAAVAKVFGQQA